MCDLKLFQAILLVNFELLCLFSGNVSIVLSNNYSDICYVHFCNSLVEIVQLNKLQVIGHCGCSCLFIQSVGKLHCNSELWIGMT